MSAQRHCDDDTLNKLHGILVMLTGGEYEPFLESLPPSFVATVPKIATNPGARLFQVLGHLNNVGSLSDGRVPLLILLNSIRAVYKDRIEAAAIERIVDVIRTGQGSSLSAAAPRIAAASPALAEPWPPPPPRSGTSRSPLRVDILYPPKLDRARSLEQRLFQTLTGEPAPAFRDLHVPLRRLVLTGADPLSGRPHGVRRLTLALTGAQSQLTSEALSVLRARAAADGDMERVALACVDELSHRPPELAEFSRLHVDTGDEQLCAMSLDATLLDALCGWLSGPGELSAPRTIALAAVDAHGQMIANDLLDWMHAHGLDAALLEDWTPGPGQDTTTAAVVIFRTDGWANAPRGERAVLAAKEHGVPIVVVEALARGEDRSFPYLGNTPTVRWMPAGKGGPPSGPDDGMATSETQTAIALQAATIARAALQEALRVRLARHRVEAFGPLPPGMHAAARPPELLDAAHAAATFILYPDPPVGEHEIALIRRVRPHLRILTPTQWLSRPADVTIMPTGTNEPHGGHT